MHSRLWRRYTLLLSDTCKRTRMASTVPQAYLGSDSSDRLGPRDEQLLRVYLTACNHQSQALPAVARAALDTCQCEKQVGSAACPWPQSCLGSDKPNSFAGYAPCLAACKHLHKAGVLGPDIPGKVDAPPGNAFELVYAKVSSQHACV